MGAVAQLVAQLPVEEVGCRNLSTSGRNVQADASQARRGALDGVGVDRLPAAERAAAGLQPGDESGSGSRVRRGDGDEALRRTALRGWTRLASGAGSRARKYRHLLDEALDADDAELALLTVLMLRGPQTSGELKQRTERLHDFADLAAVHDTLDRLIERKYVARLERRPGQKEERYVGLGESG